MPVATPSNTRSFSTPKELRQWLAQYHDTATELWVKIYKKGSGVNSVSWDDVVIESLCWGWIDGIKKSVDVQAYLQRITPRTTRSNWSKRNTQHVARLIDEGLMEAPGLHHVNAAKADGRWDKAYSVSEMEVPEDFMQALADKPTAKQFFETLTKSNRYVIAYGLQSAKKATTRSKRFDKFMTLLEDEIKPK